MENLINQASRRLGAKISIGILLNRKQNRPRGLEAVPSGTIFDIFLLALALLWIPLQRRRDPATFMALTETQIVFFKVNEGLSQRALGGITSQRSLNELVSIKFEGDQRREVCLKFTDATELIRYFHGDSSELESFIAKTVRYQSGDRQAVQQH